MFGFKIYYRKKRIRISVRANISGTLLTTFKKLFRFVGSHPSQSSYSFLFQVFDNVLLNLKVMKLKVGVHSPLNQALNQSLLDD